MKYIATVNGRSARDEFYRQNFIAVDLLEIQLPGGTLYYSTGGIDIPWDSPTTTGGSHTYEAQGDFLGFSGLNEDMDLKVGKFSVTLSALANNIVYLFVDLSTSPQNKVSYEGSRVVLYKAFLDVNTLQIVGEPMLTFDGTVFNVSITENSNTATISIECSSLYADFERTAGRKTNNYNNWLYQGVQYDTCFEQCAYVGQSKFSWGKI